MSSNSFFNKNLVPTQLNWLRVGHNRETVVQRYPGSVIDTIGFYTKCLDERLMLLWEWDKKDFMENMTNEQYFEG